MKRTEKSQKKSKFIFLIILIAALISVTGTYAWFSTQRDVEIVGFRINVETAENLEISLNGEEWSHTINIENMRQFYGTYVDYTPNTSVYQAEKDQHRNYVPTELLPVSTIGNVSEDGNLIFAMGDVRDNKLTNIKKCSEEDITVGSTIKDKETKNANHPYLVFDMYLKNLSRLTEDDAGDPLQLNTDSYVTAAGQNTGLEYCVRVGFVQYDETVSIHEGEDENGTAAQKIRAIAANGNETVSIWEPNSKFHMPFVVSNDARISNKIEAIETKAIIVSEDGTLPESIENVKDPDETALAVVYTNKPVQVETEEAMNSQSYVTKELLNLIQIDGETPVTLKPNTITKMRCYIWLEGQDPDCVDIASTGEEVVATLRLIKPPANVTGGNSYAEPNEAPDAGE